MYLRHFVGSALCCFVVGSTVHAMDGLFAKEGCEPLLAEGDRLIGEQDAEVLQRLSRAVLAGKMPEVDDQVVAQAVAAIEPSLRYLGSLGRILLEREFAIRAGFASLIERKNTLFLGAAGNAKSMISAKMLGNITFPEEMRNNGFALSPVVGKRDLFRSRQDQAASGRWISYRAQQFSSETRLADIYGSIDMNLLFPKEGPSIREMNLLEGAANHVYVFFDEFLDANAELLRGTFPLLNERIIPNGKLPFPAATQTVFAATNVSLPVAYKKAGQLHIPMESVFDRFGHIAIIPKKFAYDGDPAGADDIRGRYGSMVAVMHNHLTGVQGDVEPLDYRHLFQLQQLRLQVRVSPFVLAMIEKVGEKTDQKLTRRETQARIEYESAKKTSQHAKPPYRKTKQFSIRMYNDAADALRTIVVLEWIAQQGRRPLYATFADVAGLVSFMAMDGPRTSDLSVLLKKSAEDEDEQLSLQTVLIERQAFLEAFHETVQEFEEFMSRQ